MEKYVPYVLLSFVLVVATVGLVVSMQENSDSQTGQQTSVTGLGFKQQKEQMRVSYCQRRALHPTAQACEQMCSIARRSAPASKCMIVSDDDSKRAKIEYGIDMNCWKCAFASLPVPKQPSMPSQQQLQQQPSCNELGQPDISDTLEQCTKKGCAGQCKQYYTIVRGKQQLCWTCVQPRTPPNLQFFCDKYIKFTNTGIDYLSLSPEDEYTKETTVFSRREGLGKSVTIEQKEDYCWKDNVLIETSCAWNKKSLSELAVYAGPRNPITLKEIKCEFGCEKGACKKQPTPTTCTKGWKCKDANRVGYLQENDCDSWIESTITTCKNGCLNDKCNTFCSETDNKFDIYKQGTLDTEFTDEGSGGPMSRTGLPDRCVIKSSAGVILDYPKSCTANELCYIEEFFCDETSSKGFTIDRNTRCQYGCSNGACNKEAPTSTTLTQCTATKVLSSEGAIDFTNLLAQNTEYAMNSFANKLYFAVSCDSSKLRLYNETRELGGIKYPLACCEQSSCEKTNNYGCDNGLTSLNDKHSLSPANQKYCCKLNLPAATLPATATGGTQQTSAQQESCSETDNGLDYTNFGVTTEQRKIATVMGSSYAYAEIKHSDQCLRLPPGIATSDPIAVVGSCPKNDPCYIEEHACVNGKYVVDKTHGCEDGCENGACNKAPQT